VASRTYRPEHNAVDYVFKAERGPVVEIAADGYKLSQHVLRKLVPIYEEGAVDDDLLNEGRRNIQNHLQTLGYFDAAVSVSRRNTADGRMQIVYTVNPGDRHKLAAIRVSGNRFFSDEQIRSRMQDQAAGRLFSHGRYSEAYLEEDVNGIERLYRASGFRQVKVTSKLVETYRGDPSLLAIDVAVQEGPQTRVAWVRIEGSYTLRRNNSRRFRPRNDRALTNRVWRTIATRSSKSISITASPMPPSRSLTPQFRQTTPSPASV